MGKFRALAAHYGVFVEYERDRAGRDIGLHLTQPKSSGDGKIVTPALIWFQMKGIMAGTLSRQEFEAVEKVTLDMEVAHLRFWYLNVQPTYLALYIESVDRFLAIDLQRWVRDHFGDQIMTLGQKTVRVKVDKKNELDNEFFRIVLNRNLIASLRQSLDKDDDKEIARFLRDSSVVQWMSNCRQKGGKARLTVVKWISKMRTEAYFEACEPDGDWELFRTHWQYSMGELALAFPYLKFIPEASAEPVRYPEVIEDFDGHEFKIWHESFIVIETETGEELDEDEFEGECLLEIGDGEYSYGNMGGGEMVEHRLAIELNEMGARWADTLTVLVNAEVISVNLEPHMISVAPWHARDA
ncbi:DUF4365 domain-containing protein [Roseovarius pacificus]